MKNDTLPAPVLKWVGGKRQLLSELTTFMPGQVHSYCEPFLGGGAVLFRLLPGIALISDINKDLIHMYEVIRDNVNELVAELQKHKNEQEYFYRIRSWDRDKDKFPTTSKVQKAARLIYLNKTCYNGLYRVNRAGEFNTPFGKYINPCIVNAEILLAVSAYLRKADISLACADYADVLATISKDTFVYLDPPYDPVSDTASFTGYSQNGFGRNEQIRLRKCCDDLDKRGIRFMLSNSATRFIKNQYAAYNITAVRAKRTVNSVSTKRGAVDELVVRNYD